MHNLIQIIHSIFELCFGFHFSAPINSTNQVHTKFDCVNCSAVTTCTGRLQWVVGGINFSDTGIQANYFTRGNISFISDIFQRETNGSVVVCQHGNGEVNPWRIMIISMCVFLFPSTCFNSLYILRF